MMTDEEGTRAVLDYWFGTCGESDWWDHDPALDDAIRARFLDLWHAWRDRVPESFLGSADQALAAVVLFDQLPRNMFRGRADAFATDPLALAIARGAVDARFDATLPTERRQFLYMPFQHSENAHDQDRSVALFTALGDAEAIRYATLHRDTIARFGRFPGRNAALGRADRLGEADAIAASEGW
jgi:uncharacterized protein (DUF924 family)